ncbi:hypothetical protein NQ318_016986 [Aromia moschata]|uniref:Uncharacterized protein n=1 Tax=Aromia moschata TaxID=1265417 RepID=A0AAV8YF27_9CUCU|nr:hypothetical protein NQ318_016986 [Aromia moschata]
MPQHSQSVLEQSAADLCVTHSTPPSFPYRFFLADYFVIQPNGVQEMTVQCNSRNSLTPKENDLANSHIVIIDSSSH